MERRERRQLGILLLIVGIAGLGLNMPETSTTYMPVVQMPFAGMSLGTMAVGLVLVVLGVNRR